MAGPFSISLCVKTLPRTRSSSSCMTKGACPVPSRPWAGPTGSLLMWPCQRRIQTRTARAPPEAAAPKPGRKCSSLGPPAPCRHQLQAEAGHRLLGLLQLGINIILGDVFDDLCLVVVGVSRHGCQDRGTINLPQLPCCRKFLNNSPSISGESSVFGSISHIRKPGSTGKTMLHMACTNVVVAVSSACAAFVSTSSTASLDATRTLTETKFAKHAGSNWMLKCFHHQPDFRPAMRFNQSDAEPIAALQ